MFAWIDLGVAAVAFAGGVYGHDWVLQKVQGAETFAKNLEAKATAIKSAATSAVSTVSAATTAAVDTVKKA